MLSGTNNPGKRKINLRAHPDGGFTAALRCENLEIHKIFLRFSPLIGEESARQGAHVD
jgi:hypothetical protein